jgi:hypothetical protein
MLVRPEEIMQGEIRHALSMPIRNTDGKLSVAPATKIEHPSHPGDQIPEGMRFALKLTDEQIDEWTASLPKHLPEVTRYSARVIATALRDYGWFITDTSVEPFRLDPISPHGPSHWRTVEQNGLGLSTCTGADELVVRLFAVFHDDISSLG